MTFRMRNRLTPPWQWSTPESERQGHTGKQTIATLQMKVGTIGSMLGKTHSYSRSCCTPANDQDVELLLFQSIYLFTPAGQDTFDTFVDMGLSHQDVLLSPLQKMEENTGTREKIVLTKTVLLKISTWQT